MADRTPRRSGNGSDPIVGALGLDAEDIAGYQVLANLGEADSAEFERHWTGRTSGAVVLRRLVRHGLVTRMPGRPARYRAQDPRPILDERLAARPDAAEADPLLADIAGLTVRTPRVAGDRPVVTERWRELEAPGRVGETLAAAKTSVRAMGTFGFMTPEWLATTRLQLASRGVGCRVLCSRADIADDQAPADLPHLAQARQETRLLPTLPSRFCLVDESCGLLASGREIVVVHPSTFLDGLSLLFDLLWQRALPIQVSDTDATAGLPADANDQRSQILAMMLSGLTDQAMARRLGIGYRTMQRRIAELMDDMGVRSRFQLGIQAALRSDPLGVARQAD